MWASLAIVWLVSDLLRCLPLVRRFTEEAAAPLAWTFCFVFEFSILPSVFLQTFSETDFGRLGTGHVSVLRSRDGGMGDLARLRLGGQGNSAITPGEHDLKSDRSRI